MAEKKVYANPGQLIRICFVPKEFTADASGFKMAAYQHSLLLQAIGPGEISFGHPMLEPIIREDFLVHPSTTPAQSENRDE